MNNKCYETKTEHGHGLVIILTQHGTYAQIVVVGPINITCISIKKTDKLTD